MTALLDANVIVALMVEGHVHHDAAEEWLASTPERFATCPITEGALVRYVLRVGQGIRTAIAMLDSLAADPRYEFWADTLPYREVRLNGVIGHGQVTDAYLLALARAHDSRLVTFDRGLFVRDPENVELIATS